MRSLLICLGTVCAITAAVYFGGNAMFPVPDTSDELQKMAAGKAQARSNNASTESEPDTPSAIDTTDTLPEKIETAEQLRDAFARFHHEFDANQFEKAFDWISLVADKQPENTNFQLRKADVAFFIGKFDESVQAYDKAIAQDKELGPDLWQRGLALYYAEQFDEGIEQFQLHQTVNSEDVENAVWHFLCSARSSDVKTARSNLIEIKDDARVPMPEIFQMFAGTLEPQEVLDQFGVEADRSNGPSRLEQYYAHLYVGLYLESIGESKKSLESIRSAAKVCPLPRGNFMGEVARVHIAARESQSE